MKQTIPALMGQKEREILEILENHVGIENAITGEEIARMTNLDVREVRRCIENLRKIYLYPISASTSKPAGYFFPSTASEIEKTYKSLWHRGICILETAARLKKNEVLDKLIGQLRLFSGGGK